MYCCSKALVVVAALALAAPAVAGATGPEPNDPVDPPLLNAKPPGPPTLAEGRAMLRVVSGAPLRLQGVGFRRSEVVRITVTTGNGRLVRQLRAGLRGGFAVTFLGVRDDCNSSPPEIVARGAATGRVVVLPRDCPMT